MIIALDLGKNYTGVAISEQGFLARRHSTIASNKLRTLLEDFRPEKVIIGIPKTLRNQIGSEARKTLKKIETIKKWTKAQVILEDEVLTSEEAIQNLKEAGFAPSQIKKLVHQEAARILLQNYLDRENR